jgi:hypothetical protein
MHALALKLAAVGTGAALAAGAAGAKASATTAAGTGLAATGSSVLTKIAVSVALIGAAATGGTVLLRQPSAQVQQAPMHEVAATAPAVAQREGVAQPALAQPAPAVVAERAQLAAPVLEKTEKVEAAEPVAALEQTSDGTESKTERRERREHRHSAARPADSVEATAASAEQTVTRATPPVQQVKGEPTKLSEIDLLTKARSALAARPREAYRLTEEHKGLYPQGVFAQERDALAVEALQRAGDLKHARELAEVFLKHYPSSPAAHRFRETMNLP